MLATFYRFFPRPRQPAPSGLRATEPETLRDWHAEIAFEEGRRRNAGILKRMAARGDMERLAAMPWRRRWLARLVRFIRRAGRAGDNS